MQLYHLILQLKTELILLLGATTCILNLYNLELMDVYWTQHCWIVQKIT